VQYVVFKTHPQQTAGEQDATFQVAPESQNRSSSGGGARRTESAERRNVEHNQGFSYIGRHASPVVEDSHELVIVLFIQKPTLHRVGLFSCTRWHLGVSYIHYGNTKYTRGSPEQSLEMAFDFRHRHRP